MEDIYENLDNYCYDQIKAENDELKTKLQKITSQLTNVQTDYDNLKIEFKKLETHFSSLLKTAKSEIQRKTQLISTLNAEKDKLIINQVLNENKKYSCYDSYSKCRTGNNACENRNEPKKSEESLTKDPRIRELEQDNKTELRLEESKKHIVGNSQKEIANKNVNSIRDKRKSIDTRQILGNSDEENIQVRIDKVKSEDLESNKERKIQKDFEDRKDPLRLRESRKSFYDAKPRNSPIHFSSDEEDKRSRNKMNKNYHSTKEDYSSKRDIRRRLGERPYRSGEKYSDNRNYKDKYFSKNEPIRQRRKSTYDFNERYKSSSSEGEENHKSRERPKSRIIKDLHRKRESHSPNSMEKRSSDRNSRESSRYEKYNDKRDLHTRNRADYKKRDSSRCYEESTERHIEKQSSESKTILESPSNYKSKDRSSNENFNDRIDINIEPRRNKHKLESDEPITTKRLRTDEEHGNQKNCNKDDGKLFSNSETPPKVGINIKNNNNEDIQNFKDVEVSKFQQDIDTRDPRLSSNKYVKVVDAKENIFITTVIGNTVDLKYIKYDNAPQVTFPTPMNCVDMDENHIKEIYRNIDRQVYLSPESGELLDSEDTNDVYFSEQSLQANENTLGEEESIAKEFNIKSQVTSNTQACEMSVFGHYKIPKLSDKKHDLTKTTVLVNENKSSLQDTKLTNDNVSTCNINENNKESKTEFIKKMNALVNSESREYKQFVAQDLELSDENNDSQELSDISDATLNTTKELVLNNTKLTSKDKQDESEEIRENLISPEDLDLSVPTKFKLENTDAPTLLVDDKIKQPNELQDCQEILIQKDKNKEKSNKSKDKSKHKKKASKKEKHSKSKERRSNSLSDDSISKDIINTNILNKSVANEALNSNIDVNIKESENLENNESQNVSVYEVSSSVPVKLESPAQNLSPKIETSPPDIRIVIKRRTIAKKSNT